MLMFKKFMLTISFLMWSVIFFAPPVCAKGSEFAAIVKHLETNYQAKKVNLHFMWLARFAVKVVRPAGVKSFNVTLFENLKFSRDTLDNEMQSAMRNSFGAEWSSIFRVRSRDGQQAYMYMREDGKNIKITLVTIDNTQAAVIRATFDPGKLVEFINNPKIFGISIGDNNRTTDNKTLQTIH
jgi:hypothetical protein